MVFQVHGGCVGNSQCNDSIWQAAVEWVVREHENPLDDVSQAQLRAWLNASVEHRAAYEKACRVWLLTGLVPPKHGM